MSEYKPKKGAFSIRFASQKSAKGCMSFKHDIRDMEYLEKMLNSSKASERSIVKDIEQTRSKYNIYYELTPGKSIDDYQKEAETRYIKAIKQKPQKNTVFIRPAILTVREDTTLEQILEMGQVVHKLTGMTLLFAACHKDEGHYKDTNNGRKVWVGNYHVHAYFLSQNLEDRVQVIESVDEETGEKNTITKIVKAGRTCRNIPFSQLQTELAPIFNMERGNFKNQDRTAYQDPKERFSSERTTKAAQLIKAEAQLSELKAKSRSLQLELDRQANLLHSSFDILRKRVEAGKDWEVVASYLANKTEKLSAIITGDNASLLLFSSGLRILISKKVVFSIRDTQINSIKDFIDARSRSRRMGTLDDMNEYLNKAKFSMENKSGDSNISKHTHK